MPNVFNKVFGDDGSGGGGNQVIVQTVTQYVDPRSVIGADESYSDDSADLFADMLLEWPSGKLGMEYRGTKRDMIKSMANPSFEMELSNYKRNMDCEVLCLRSQNLDLVADWKASSREKRPLVILLTERFQCLELQDEEPGACIKLMCRLLQ